MLTSRLQLWKEALKSGKESLENAFFSSKNTDQLLKGHPTCCRKIRAKGDWVLMLVFSQEDKSDAYNSTY